MENLGRYQRRRRLALGILVGLMLFCLLFVGSDGAPGGLHEYIEQVAAILILVTVVGRCWCTCYIGGRKGFEVVRDGPYSMTRNPLYVFSVIGAAGIGAMTGSVIISMLFAVLTYAAFHFVIRVEETHLIRVFGEPYRAYMREVPRFFPNPALFVDSEVLTVRPHFLYRTFRDALVFALAYPFFEVVEYLQNSGFLPILFKLY